MTSTTSSTTLLAGSALLIAAAAVTFGKFSSSSNDSLQITEIDDNGDIAREEYITEDDICNVFDRLFMEMQGVLGQLSQQIQQLQMAGQQIPEAQLRQLLKQEFERALSVKQKQIYEDCDLDEDCLEEATWAMLDQAEEYPKAKVAVERFQKLWENVSGETVVGMRPGQAAPEPEQVELLSPDKLVETAEVYFGSLTDAMRGLVQKYKDEGKDLTSPAVAKQLNMEFTATANDAGSQALEEIGSSLNQFQKSIEAHANKPQVGRALQMLQMKQQQELMSMGVPGM